MINLINVILGGALLLAGRKLFWHFVGAIGFVTGLQLATSFWQGSEVLALVFGLVIGVIFACWLFSCKQLQSELQVFSQADLF